MGRMVDRHASTRSFLDATLPLVLEFLVVCLLATRLNVLDLPVLVLEATILFFLSKNLLRDCSLPLLVVNATAEELCCALLDRANLTVLWQLHRAIILFVVAMWIEYVSHFDELVVTLELGSLLGLRQTKPRVAGGSFLLLWYTC